MTLCARVLNETKIGAIMLNAILDWVPLICFFVAFKMQGIYFATKVIIIASFMQLLISKFILKNKIELMNWAIFALVIIMGGLTLFFHNEAFIKWKPTILYIAFAIAFIVTPILKNKGLAELMLASKIQLPKAAWRNLNLCFIAFFMIMALLNTYVFMMYSTATWVNYKLFGTLIITIAFLIIVSYFIAKNKVSN